MKQRFQFVIALSIATLGGGAALAACISDEPGPITLPKDDSGTDIYVPGFDANPDQTPAEWTPKSHPGLVLWLDGADPSSVLRSSTGDGRVTQWTDKSDKGWHFKAPANTPSQTPIFTTGALNDRTALVFRSANSEHLVGPSLNGKNLTAAEALVAVRIIDPSDGGSGSLPQLGLWRFGINQDGSEQEPELYPNNDAKIYGGFASATRPMQFALASVQPPLDLTKSHIYDCASALDWTAWLDGKQIFTSPGNTVSFDPVQSLIGAGTATRSGATQLFPFSGVIGEILIFNEKLDTEERATATKYLAKRWGAPVP